MQRGACDFSQHTSHDAHTHTPHRDPVECLAYLHKIKVKIITPVILLQTRANALANKRKCSKVSSNVMACDLLLSAVGVDIYVLFVDIHFVTNIRSFEVHCQRALNIRTNKQ